MTAGIALAGVSRVFADGTRALDSVDLIAEAGELLVVTGPTGCGKTTLLRVVAGLEPDATGRVSIAGRDVTDLPARERDVAMVAQDAGLYPHLSARDNLAFALRLRGVPADETARRVEAEARALGIRRLLHRRPGRLAVGDRRRVALGRATTRVPAAYLLDEPLSGLDPHVRTRLRAEIATLQRGLGVTTLYVTHDPTEAMALGGRLAVMAAGRLHQVGPPQQLYEHPADTVVAAHVGDGTVSLLSATVADEPWPGALVLGGQRLVLSPARRTAAAGRGRLIVGIRPEHLRPPAPFAVDAQTLRVTVEAVERPGPALLVSARLDPATGPRLRFALPVDRDVAPGQQVEVAVEVEALLLFDADTGLALD